MVVNIQNRFGDMFWKIAASYKWHCFEARLLFSHLQWPDMHADGVLLKLTICSYFWGGTKKKCTICVALGERMEVMQGFGSYLAIFTFG